MVPRGRLDISWAQLAFAAAACASPGRAADAERPAAAAWSSDGDALPCFSVRSGLDLVLRALALPRGSRVLVSAVTIRDMARVLEHHGLVPVPVDLDMTTVGVTRAALARAARPGTVAVLVAHLFGSRMPMDDVVAFTRERGLLLFEDCAQAYDGRYRGHGAADVSFFSFGTIKTSTALGGAILRFRDRALLTRVRSIQQSDPQQARRAYFARVCRHAALKLATWPPLYTLLVRGCERLGRDHDDLLRAAVRGFGNDGDSAPLIGALRHRPSYPLLALLARRLLEAGIARVARRVIVAEDVLARLRGIIDRPGAASRVHAHWVLPVYAPDPDALVLHLRRRGFDATRRGSALCVIDAPPDQPDADAPQARAAMSRMVFLPLSASMTARDARGLAEAVADAVRADAPTETPTVLAPWAS